MLAFNTGIAAAVALVRDAHIQGKVTFLRFAANGGFAFDLKKEISVQRDIPKKIGEIRQYHAST